MNLQKWIPDLPPPKQMPSNKDLPGACRVQSPSSILTYKQCPRKYYYRYIEKLPGPRSIHLIRGSIVHKVLEDIYDIDVSKFTKENFFYTLKIVLQEALRKEWFHNSDELGKLGLSPEKLDEYYEESRLMVDNFYHMVYDQLNPLLEELGPAKAFAAVTPQREILMKSPQHLVKGYIDVIATEGDKTVILDYKTSKKLAITPEYKLQLGIYAMMHEEAHHPAHEVGVIFLKHGQELRVPVTKELVNNAKDTCLNVQMYTKSTNMRDYPKNPTPLCKWRTGQCEYYELCFMNQSVDEYRQKINFKR